MDISNYCGDGKWRHERKLASQVEKYETSQHVEVALLTWDCLIVEDPEKLRKPSSGSRGEDGAGRRKLVAPNPTCGSQTLLLPNPASPGKFILCGVRSE